MQNLTEKEKIEITKEMMDKEPLLTVGTIALIKISELAIAANSEETELSIELVFNDKKYTCKMVSTWEEIV